MPSRRVSLVGSAALAIALNAAALGLAGQVPAQWSSVVTRRVDSPKRSITLITPTAIAATPKVDVGTAPPVNAERELAVRQKAESDSAARLKAESDKAAPRKAEVDTALPVNAASSTAEPPPRIDAASAKSPLPASEAAHEVRFYRFDEVERPAAPVADWNVDAAALDALGLARLVFEVLISDRGEIVGCTVIDPPALADDIRLRLEQRLRETALQPAMRADVPVASVRRIELMIADTAEARP